MGLSLKLDDGSVIGTGLTGRESASVGKVSFARAQELGRAGEKDLARLESLLQQAQALVPQTNGQEHALVRDACMQSTRVLCMVHGVQLIMHIILGSHARVHPSCGHAKPCRMQCHTVSGASETACSTRAVNGLDRAHRAPWLRQNSWPS